MTFTFNKKIGTLIGILILAIVGYNAYDLTTDFVNNKENSSYQQGISDSLATIFNQSQNGQIITLQNNEQTTQLVSLNALYNRASENGQLQLSNGDESITLVDIEQLRQQQEGITTPENENEK